MSKISLKHIETKKDDALKTDTQNNRDFEKYQCSVLNNKMWENSFSLIAIMHVDGEYCHKFDSSHEDAVDLKGVYTGSLVTRWITRTRMVHLPIA